MRRKVYKEGYQIIVNPPLFDHLKYTNSTYLRFSFDGDNCSIKYLITGEYIFNDNISEMLDSEGTPLLTKDNVEDYLLNIIGDPTSDESPLSPVEYGIRFNKANSDAIIIPDGFVGDGSEISLVIQESDDTNYSVSNGVASSSTNGFLSIAMRSTSGARLIVADSSGKTSGTTYSYVAGDELSMRLSGQDVSLYINDVLQQTISMTGYVPPATRSWVIGAFSYIGALGFEGVISSFKTELEEFNCNEGIDTPVGSLGTVTSFVNTPEWELL